MALKVALDATPLILSSGGLARYVTELSLALSRAFPEDTYTLLSDQPFRMPENAPPNLRPGSGAQGTKRWWLWGLKNVLEAEGTDLFHGTNFEVPYLGRTPAVLTIHDLSPWRDPVWHDSASRVRQRTPWLVKFGRARIVLTVSEAVRREVIRYFKLPAEKVRAVPLAASRLFAPASVAPHPRPFFLFVGTLEPRKNLSTLIEAWRSTHEETGVDLVIAGRRRAGFPPVPSVEGLSYIGEVPDEELPRLYSQALAFVYPSHYEGFGLPVLEAMQCGCPVVTSNDPAITEVASGAALQVGSPLELANALRTIVCRAELREEMRRDGLARAQSFSWSRTAHATRAIYAEVLA
jgi:glycosyltransferase involved in cell wall biosynthesis